jgi:dTDP-glucose pyrophosphorylase
MNIVIPMAGRGSRFADVGYALPKPLLPVLGRPMIEVVIENLRPADNHRFVFICQQEHLQSSDLGDILRNAGPDTAIIPIDRVTDGAACTVLLAEQEIHNGRPLMIANCDQYVSTPIDEYLSMMTDDEYDGLIMTMTADDPKWSYVRISDTGDVIEVVEKKVISNEATVGIYNFRKGSDFVSAAHSMIRANDRTNGEFYVAPAYNYMIAAGHKIGFTNIGKERDGMYGLGVPDDLEYFNALGVLPKA